MPNYVYISLQDDNKISVFTMDAGTGKLTPKAEVPVSGGPALLTISPDRAFLYVGHRDPPGISSWRIDHGTGGLTQIGTVSTDGWSAFLATDRKGKYLLSPIIKQGMLGSIPSEMTERWESHPSNGWQRTLAPTRFRPTHPTSLPSCLISPAYSITSWNPLRMHLGPM